MRSIIISPTEINLHIPPEKNDTVILDLLIHNLAMTKTLYHFVVYEITKISNPSLTMEELEEKVLELNKNHGEITGQTQKEIIADLMSRYIE